MSKNDGKGIIFMIGAAIGALVALLMATDEEGETKKPVKGKLKKVKTKIKENPEAERLLAIFGEKSAKVQETYSEAVGMLNEKLTSFKGSVGEIDKSKYTAIVDEVVSDMKTASTMTATQLKKLKSFMLQDFEKLKKS